MSTHRPHPGLALVLLAALLMAAPACSLTRAAEPAAAAQAAPDWIGLRKLLVGGDYPAAVAAADEIVTAAGTPRAKDPDFLPRTITRVQALLYRGFAERSLGTLDSAEATLKQAFDDFRDRDFQRLLTLQARQGGAAIIPKIVPLELAWLDLLHLRCLVLIDRIRADRTEPDEATTDDPAAVLARRHEEVDSFVAEFSRLEKLATEARAGLPARLAKAGGSLAGSPYNQAVAGGFQAALVAGLIDVELAKLPFPVDRSRGRPLRKDDGQEPASQGLTAITPEERSNLLVEAFTHFVEANTILGQAERAAAPKSGGLKPEQKAELLRLRAELLGAEAAGRLVNDELSLAEAAGNEAVALTETSLTLQKIPAANHHPDLAGPLLLAAKIAVARAEGFGAAAAAKARGDVLAADRLLERVDGIFAAHPDAFPQHHPLLQKQAAAATRLERLQAQVATALPRSDAADAAARRAIQSIERMDESAAPF